MDRFTPEQRSNIMRSIRSKGSKIENSLAKSLFKKGVRYRRNVKSVFGCPDICIKKYKIAVFCDSEFWHGKDWQDWNNRFQSNQAYWIPKIERNIQRDIEVNEKLKNEGWTVLRFWAKEINENLENCTNRILHSINDSKTKK